MNPSEDYDPRKTRMADAWTDIENVIENRVLWRYLYRSVSLKIALSAQSESVAREFCG